MKINLIKTRYIVIVLSIILPSCCSLVSNKITYSYNDVCIKRIDECGKSTFYYYRNKLKENGEIWTEFAGINSGFSGYLQFEDNGSVKLLSGDGYFQSKNLDTTKFLYKRVYSYNAPKLGGNVYGINNAIKVEKEQNEESVYDIKVKYKVWW
jgi:hypothetical protein